MLVNFLGLFLGKIVNKNWEDMDVKEKSIVTARVVTIPCLFLLIGYLVAKGGNDALVNQLLEILKESMSG